jgi:hypothetical protein
VIREIPISIRGQSWTLKLVTRKGVPKKTWGDCNSKTKIIRVRSDLSRKNFLDTLIHEIRHAQHEICYEAEEFINWTSTEIAHVICQVEATLD